MIFFPAFNSLDSGLDMFGQCFLVVFSGFQWFSSGLDSGFPQTSYL